MTKAHKIFRPNTKYLTNIWNILIPKIWNLLDIQQVHASINEYAAIAIPIIIHIVLQYLSIQSLERSQPSTSSIVALLTFTS